MIGTNAGGIPELIDRDCIFEKSDYKELAEIISKNGLDKKWLRSKAIRNFEEAKNMKKKK